VETAGLAGNSFQSRLVGRLIQGGNLQPVGFRHQTWHQNFAHNYMESKQSPREKLDCQALFTVIFHPARTLKLSELEEFLPKAAPLKSFLRQEIPNLRVSNATA
jgi:hypothetical protein